MPQFRFKAIDVGGKVVNGTSSAQDSASLSSILQEQGLFLMECAEVPPAPLIAHAGPTEAPLKGALRLPRRRRKVRLKDLSFMTAQFSIMVRSALPILEALNLLTAQTPHPELKDALRQIARSVSEGLPLSGAFAKRPDIFDDIYISLLAAGEMGGDLDQMLGRLADHLSFRVRLAQNIRSALAYPLVVLLTTSAVVSFMVVFVLPTFMEIFVQLNIDLPWPTRFLIHGSELLRAWWWVPAAAVGVSVPLFQHWLKNAENARLAGRVQLGIPVLGTLVLNIVMTRTLRTMGSLIEGGVSILKCLELSRAASGHPIFSDLLEKVAVDVREGKSLSAAFAASPYMPAIVVGMLATGERTGRLPEVITRVAAFYESETDSSIKDLFSVIEPVFIVGLGTMVGGIAISVLLPLFELAQGVQ